MQTHLPTHTCRPFAKRHFVALRLRGSESGYFHQYPHFEHLNRLECLLISSLHCICIGSEYIM